MFSISHGFWGSEYGSILALWPGSGNLVGLQPSILPRLWSLKTWLELNHMLQDGTHMAVSEHQEASVLAGCRKDMLGSSPCGPLYTLLDCPPNVAGKQRGICCAFYELQVILHHVHSILLVKRKWLNTAHTQEEGTGLCLLKRSISTHLWMCF